VAVKAAINVVQKILLRGKSKVDISRKRKERIEATKQLMGDTRFTDTFTLEAKDKKQQHSLARGHQP
jgi:hypothetical protein